MTCTNCWTCNDRPCAMEKLHPSRHKPRPGLSPNKLYIRKTEYSIRHKIHESNYSNIHYSVRVRTPLITFSSCQFTVQQLMLPASNEVPHRTQHEERAPAKKKSGPLRFSQATQCRLLQLNAGYFLDINYLFVACLPSLTNVSNLLPHTSVYIYLVFLFGDPLTS